MREMRHTDQVYREAAHTSDDAEWALVEFKARPDYSSMASHRRHTIAQRASLHLSVRARKAQI